LSLISLPPEENQAHRLQEHLTQISWAGEIEGWLTASPHYYLVATPEVAEIWRNLLPPGHPVDVVAPLSEGQLAAMTVRRAVAQEPRLNLLPPEFTTRYKQVLIDRLWIRALMAMGLIYIVGVALYMGWAQLVRWQHNRIEAQVAGLSESYTNTVQLKEEVRVLQDQLDLQFAALEAWKAVAEELPTGLQLDNLNFQRGRTLSLSGTATPGASEDIISFNESLQGKQFGERPLFKDVEAPRTGERQGQIFWSFAAQLDRAESE
jgi:Tfp pilus assembly protein PilN